MQIIKRDNDKKILISVIWINSTILFLVCFGLFGLEGEALFVSYKYIPANNKHIASIMYTVNWN